MANEEIMSFMKNILNNRSYVPKPEDLDKFLELAKFSQNDGGKIYEDIRRFLVARMRMTPAEAAREVRNIEIFHDLGIVPRTAREFISRFLKTRGYSPRLNGMFNCESKKNG